MLSLDEVRRLPTVLTVEEAGKLFDLSKSAAYDAVRRGEIPVIRFGRRMMVPTAKVLVMLGLFSDEDAGGAAESSPAGGEVC